MFQKLSLRVFIFWSSLFAINAFAQLDVSKLPLFKMNNLQFEGAFRVPANPGGTSSMNFATGSIAIDPERNSVFMVGHTYQQELIEFKIPKLVKSTQTKELKIASSPMQPFSKVLDRPKGGVASGINTLDGMAVIGNQLIVHAFGYYDAGGSVSVSTLIFRDKTKIATSKVDGYYHFEGAPPAHHTGWISPIPEAWQGLLGGDYITGNSSGWPIISRLSVGPSAFAFQSEKLLNHSDKSKPIPTNTLLNYSLAHVIPGASDLSNNDKSNKIWTHLTQAGFGMIVPGTRTYMVLGQSGGHESGVCYKCNKCGGYCPNDMTDKSQYYWLYDMKDLLDVFRGNIKSWEPIPYEYGPWKGPWTNSIGGGTFDTKNKLLYLQFKAADREQGQYSNPPIIAAFSFNAGGSNSLSGPQAIANREFKNFGNILNNKRNVKGQWNSPSMGPDGEIIER